MTPGQPRGNRGGGSRPAGERRRARPPREREGARKRVNPRIQIGPVVVPGDVVDRTQHSRLVEVDASGEPLPERIVTPWVERTPEHAVIDVRAHRLFTHHPVAVESLWPEVRDLLSPSIRERKQLYADDLPARALDRAFDLFQASIAPLREYGKLGAVLFPFPSYFQPGTRARDYLEWIRGRSGDVPIAIELRHRSWVSGKERDATLTFLSELQLAYVCVDEPPGFDSSLPPLSVATTDTAFVRFHGRNSGAWERGADIGDDRFAYDYRDADFEPWVARLEKLASSTRTVHVVFGGRNTDAGVRSARLLVRVLSGGVVPERKPPPSPPRRRRR